jgi:DNA repair exonuclease SbcCD ATPase subunit
MNDDIAKLEKFKEKLCNDKAIQEMASSLLKDSGVKSRIIKQYLPLINKYTNKFLNAMNFFVSFSIDEEFNEKIKSRGRDELAYANYSEGEKQRIDLALLFTWRTIAKMKNSINTNLLVMDEVFDSYLDTNATESVIQLLNSDMFKDTNIFVISHKETITDKFQSNIRFTKKKNFSIIE